MTRLNVKFPVLALCALVVIGGCTSEEGSNSPGFTTTGGTGATGAVGGTSASTGGVSGTSGAGGVSGTSGSGGVSGTGIGGTAGDVQTTGGVGGGGAGGMMAPGGAGGMMTGEGGTMAPGGAGGMGATPDEKAACIADFIAAGDTMDCAECACTECIMELGLCTEDTSPAPNPTVSKSSGEVCQEIIECAGANNCSGDACWCGCTTGPGCCDQQYMMMGPCKFEINQGGSMMDFLGGGIAGPGQMYYPSPDDKNPGPGHPIGNANVVGACIAAKCAACQ